MLERVADLRAGLAKSANPEAAALAAQLATFVGEDAPIGGAAAPTTLTAVSEWLDKLAQAVDGADAAPTPDSLRGFALVSGALNAMEPRFRALDSSARAQLPPA
jgi:hypothetical protein